MPEAAALEEEAEPERDENSVELDAARLYAEHGSNTAIFGLMGYDPGFAERAYEKHRGTIALLGLNAERVTARARKAAAAERQRAAASRAAEAGARQDRRSPADIRLDERRRAEIAHKKWLAQQPREPGLFSRALSLAGKAAGAVAREMLAERPVEPERPLTASERSRLESDIRRAMNGADFARRTGQGTGHWDANAAIAAAKLANGRK